MKAKISVHYLRDTLTNNHNGIFCLFETHLANQANIHELNLATRLSDCRTECFQRSKRLHVTTCLKPICSISQVNIGTAGSTPGEGCRFNNNNNAPLNHKTCFMCMKGPHTTRTFLLQQHDQNKMCPHLFSSHTTISNLQKQCRETINLNTAHYCKC